MKKTRTMTTLQIDESLYPDLAALLKDRASPISQTVPVSSASILLFLQESCKKHQCLDWSLKAVSDARKLVADEKAQQTGKTSWKVGTMGLCTPAPGWIELKDLAPNPLTYHTGPLRVGSSIVLHRGTQAGPAAGG